MTTETPAADIVERLTVSTSECAIIGWAVEAKTCVGAADEITRLRAENAELQRKLDEAVKALEPFAEWAEWFTECEQHPAGCPDGVLAGEAAEITVGDLRMAKSTLTSIRGEA